MRRVFRAFGAIRLFLGAMVFAVGFAFQDTLQFGPSTVLMIIGSIIALSGAISLLLVIILTALYPLMLYSFGWLIFGGWVDSSLAQHVTDRLDSIGLYIGLGIITTPLWYWYANKSWLLMADEFSLADAPSDTINSKAFDIGAVELCGDHFIAAVTLTDQGVILDRRNFKPVVLPWRWISRLKPVLEPTPLAELSLANDRGGFLVVDIPWNPDFFGLVPKSVNIVTS